MSDFEEGVREAQWTLGGLKAASQEFQRGWDAAVLGTFADEGVKSFEMPVLGDESRAGAKAAQLVATMLKSASPEFSLAWNSVMYGNRDLPESKDADESLEVKLAKMRLMLKEAPSQHRNEGGQYVTHPSVSDHTELLAHMATEHGLAILPQHRTSTRSAQAAHLVAHQTEASE